MVQMQEPVGLLIIKNLLFAVPAVLTTVGCIVYLIRTKSLPGVLMLLGTLGSIFVAIGRLILSLLIVFGVASFDFLKIGGLVLSTLALFAGLIFAFGMVLMALRTPKVASATNG